LATGSGRNRSRTCAARPSLRVCCSLRHKVASAVIATQMDPDHTQSNTGAGFNHYWNLSGRLVVV